MKFKLIERKEELPGVITFIFEPQEKISWRPGQFIHYVLNHRPTDDRGSDRWFTNAAAPFEGNVIITTRKAKEKISTFKDKLFSLKEGKSIEVSNISGDFVIDDPSKDYVFIAGGIGITPFRSILKQLDHDRSTINVTLIYSNKDENIVFKEELEELAKRNPGLKINYILSPKHVNEDVIKELVSDFKKQIFYISGPEPMVDSVIETLKKMGILEENIKGDWFPGYPAE